MNFLLSLAVWIATSSSFACTIYFEQMMAHSDSTEKIGEAIERLGLKMRGPETRDGMKVISMVNKEGTEVAQVHYTMGVHKGELGIEIGSIRVDDPSLRNRDISTLLIASALQKNSAARFVYALMGETNLSVYQDANQNSAATPLGKSLAKFGFTRIEEKGIKTFRATPYAEAYFYLPKGKARETLSVADAEKMAERMDRRSAVGSRLPSDFAQRIAKVSDVPLALKLGKDTNGTSIAELGESVRVHYHYDNATQILFVTGVARPTLLNDIQKGSLKKAAADPDFLSVYVIENLIATTHPEAKKVAFRRPMIQSVYSPGPVDFARSLGYEKAKGTTQYTPPGVGFVEQYEVFEK